MDTPPPSASDPPKQLTPAQEQARLRRERRNAKIAATGSSRLDAITNLSGRKGPPPENSSQAQKPGPATTAPTPPQSQIPPTAAAPLRPAATPPAATVDDDPDITDISTHAYPTQQPPPFPLFPPTDPSTGVPDQTDPTIQLMQSLLSGAAPPGGPEGGLPPGLPPQLAAFLSARNRATAASSAEAHARPPAAHLWRVGHALAALALGAWCVWGSGFDGSRAARSRGVAFPPASSPGVVGDALDGDDAAPGRGPGGLVVGEDMGRRLFVAFATVQVVLQTARFFVEGGRSAAGGWLAGLEGVLPEPVAGWLRVGSRYSVIARTAAADGAVVVFVLGAASWWRGGAGR